MKLNEQKLVSKSKLIVSFTLVFFVGVSIGFIGSTYVGTTDTSPNRVSETTDLEDRDSLQAQAGVTFDDQGDSLVVQLVSIQQANEIYVVHPDGDRKTLYDSDSVGGGVGDTVTLRGLEDNDQIVVVGVLDGEESIIQTYKM